MTAQKEFEVVEKTASNPYFKSKYAPLPEVLKSALPVLAKHGLGVSQLPSGDGLLTLVFHESGEYLGATGTMFLAKADPQGQAAAITYMRRVAMLSVLGMSADEDDDGNTASQVGQNRTPTGTLMPSKKRSTRKEVEERGYTSDEPGEFGHPAGHAERNVDARVISSAVAKRNILDVVNQDTKLAAQVWNENVKGQSTVSSSKLEELLELAKALVAVQPAE